MSTRLELLEELVQEVVATAPESWQKIIFYQEFQAVADGSIRNKATARCWYGPEMREYAQSYELGGSMEAFEAAEALFNDVADNDKWNGLLLAIASDGKYTYKFFYDNTPLLDGNYEEAKRILSQAF